MVGVRTPSWVLTLGEPRQAASESGNRPSHAARRNGTKATLVKNEGAFPFADARTYRLEEGSDDETFDATSRRRGGGLTRLKYIGFAGFRTARAK
jgi:hypothetical protein